MGTPTITFEVEVALNGDIVPYCPATGPTYVSGGEPASGGYAEDVEITDIGIVEAVRPPVAEQGSHRTIWKTTSLLEGIDRNAPEIQKLFANILALKRDEASEAVMDEAEESEW